MAFEPQQCSKDGFIVIDVPKAGKGWFENDTKTTYISVLENRIVHNHYENDKTGTKYKKGERSPIVTAWTTIHDKNGKKINVPKFITILERAGA